MTPNGKPVRDEPKIWTERGVPSTKHPNEGDQTSKAGEKAWVGGDSQRHDASYHGTLTMPTDVF